jgi:hypothetical protein
MNPTTTTARRRRSSHRNIPQLRPFLVLMVFWWSLLLLTFHHEALVVQAASIDPGEDFNGYMEEMAQLEADAAAYRLKLEKHEVHTAFISTFSLMMMMLLLR